MAVKNQNQIRADFDAHSIVVYGAYSAPIADAALRAGRFVAPFSFGRMTWIKPSFLWLMERSNWGQKSGQERILAIRISRAGWDEALSMGVLTSFVPGVYRNSDEWRWEFERARIHVQWDPERSLRGADLGINSIQVGLSRHIIARFVDDRIVELRDFSPLARKVHALLGNGKAEAAKRLLPPERVYPVGPAVARRLRM